MSWTPVLTRWPQHLDQLCDRFRHLEVSALKRIRGDRVRLAAYLAQSHDLTLSEASDALDEWAAFGATPVTGTAAA